MVEMVPLLQENCIADQTNSSVIAGDVEVGVILVELVLQQWFWCKMQWGGGGGGLLGE